MADLQEIDEYKQTQKRRKEKEFDSFSIEEFKNAGQIVNEKHPVLKAAAAAELFTIEQQALQQPVQKECSKQVSHVHNNDQHDAIYHCVHTIHCPVYVPYNKEKQEILLPSTTEMSRKENAKALYATENIDEWNGDPYFKEVNTDTETFSYAHYDGPKHVVVQAVYISNYA